jgi:hypothetical protein
MKNTCEIRMYANLTGVSLQIAVCDYINKLSVLISQSVFIARAEKLDTSHDALRGLANMVVIAHLDSNQAS